MYRGSIYSSVTMISPLTNIAIPLFCSFRFIRRFLFVYLLVCSGLVSSFAICGFFSAAFAFPMIRFDGMSAGSAVAIFSVDSSRLVLFVVSSISAYIKYFHKISCNVAKPIDVTHLL